MKRPVILALLSALFLPICQTQGADWPQFRYDAGRTAASPESLPSDLSLSWIRKFPTPRPAFPLELRLAFDASYEPVVLGQSMFVPSMVDDCVTALDTESGRVRWRYFAEGPIRFAPLAWKNNLYFVSDDGYLYCLDAENGRLRWKFRGRPEAMSDRKVLGHGRLVSLWPARGGPVLKEGVIYFAAGIWPTEGIYIHALDAQTGKPLWSNTETHHIPESNWDHGIGHESGLTPQGYLAIVDDRLVIPCGAQLPAFLDPQTGELQKYTMGWGGRNGLPKGCWFVAGVKNYLSHGGDLYDISRPSEERFPKTDPEGEDYKHLLYPGGWTRLSVERDTHRELDSFRQPVMTPEVLYESDLSIVARDLSDIALREIKKENLPEERKNDPYPDTTGGVFHRLWTMDTKLDVHIKAGNRLYIGGPGVVQAIDLGDSRPKVTWKAEFEGTPQRMLAADAKLFVVTKEGSILAFTASPPKKPVVHERPDAKSPESDLWNRKTRAILAATDEYDGYALVLGLKGGRLVEELVRQSNLHVIAVDNDPKTVAKVRRRLFEQGEYGCRASVLLGDPSNYPFPPYLANLIVSETPDDFLHVAPHRLATTVFRALRPYGGVACAMGELADLPAMEAVVKEIPLPRADVQSAGEFVLLARKGPLPGAADWSHPAANAACTGASRDEFIRPPMSILWYDAAQRWHKFPGQNLVRVAKGRLVLLKEGRLRASDVYTGRTLWQIDVPVGEPPLSDNQSFEEIRYERHRVWGPKPSLDGKTQMVLLDDTIYLSNGTKLLRFDAATGRAIGTIELPEDFDQPWLNLRVARDYLVGTSGPHIVCLHRRTGDLLWRVATDRPELSLAVGAEKVFCAELVNPRHGDDASDGSLFALDLATGKEQWRRSGGAPLRYSPSQDLVVTPTTFYHARDGGPLSMPEKGKERKYVITGGGLPKTGLPGYLAGDKLLAGNEQTLQIYALPSGEQLGETFHWVRRGCTGTRASMHLLTTRYRGNSAWVDLKNGQITPFLGIRPGCQRNNNLYPANGVLNIPNITAGCTCNYTPASTACVSRAIVEQPQEK